MVTSVDNSGGGRFAQARRATRRQDSVAAAILGRAAIGADGRRGLSEIVADCRGHNPSPGRTAKQKFHSSPKVSCGDTQSATVFDRAHAGEAFESLADEVDRQFPRLAQRGKNEEELRRQQHEAVLAEHKAWDSRFPGGY